MNEIECTAFERSSETDRNTLFTPPCACPRCAPAPSFRDDDPGERTMWLPVDGKSVRHRVIALELGATGHAVLG